MTEADFIKAAGLSRLLNQIVRREAGIVEDSQGRVGGIWRNKLKPMRFAKAIEPVRYLKCVTILPVNLVFAWSRAIENSRSVSRNMAGDYELYRRPLFVVGIKLPIVSMDMNILDSPITTYP